MPIGRPKYVKGRASGLQCMSSASSLYLSDEILIGTSEDFRKFTFKPVMDVNIARIFCKTINWVGQAGRIISVSSAY